MNKKSKFIVGVILVVIIFWLGFTQYNQSKHTDKIIKIGFIGPLTETNANIGEGIKNAIEMAREKLVQNKNAKIEIIYEDDQFNGRLGITAYHKLRDIDKVDVIINTTPATINAFHSLLNEDPLIIVQIAEPEIVEDDTVFQIMPSGGSVYRDLGKLAKEKYESVAFVYQNGPAFEKAKNAFTENFGLESVKSYRIDEIVSSKDYRTLVSKIINDGLESFTIVATPGVGVPFLQQMVQQNKNNEIRLLCNADLEITITSYLDIIPYSTFDNCYSMMLPNSMPEWFTVEYKEKYSMEPLFAADYAYDSLNILYETYDPDVYKWKSNLQKLNYLGVSGEISFDELGSRLGQSAEVHVFKNGEFVKYEE